MTTSPAVTLSAAPAPTLRAVSVPVQVQALTLTESLPGFPGRRDYVLVPAEDGGRLLWLQSVAPDGPRFLAVTASANFPDCAELGLGDPEAARLYCLVTVPHGDVAAATANLRAPVVVNPATHQARQVVLLDAAHPIRRPLRR